MFIRCAIPIVGLTMGRLLDPVPSSVAFKSHSALFFQLLHKMNFFCLSLDYMKVSENYLMYGLGRNSL